ncbi:hypothetical protein [Desulfomonile tiedjei]|nr:hypothetical protein [Desulfomonile tiedjei]
MSCELLIFELVKSALQVLVVLISTYLTYAIIIVPAWSALEHYKANNGVIDSAKANLGDVIDCVRSIDITDQDVLSKASKINVLVANLGRMIREKLVFVYPDLADRLRKDLENLENLVQPDVSGCEQGELESAEANKIFGSVDLIITQCEILKICLDEWVRRGISSSWCSRDTAASFSTDPGANIQN